MQKYVEEHLPLENLVSTTHLQSLAHGYILNCRSEGKSAKTIISYQTALKQFIWFCKHNNFPEIAQTINAIHIRQFIWYLTSATGRWGSNSPKTKQPASQTTANDYYRALHSFFNWLERESLIKENPFANLHPPKLERKVIQALTPTEVERLLNAGSGKSPVNVRNKAILCIFLDTGLRVSELASLNIYDIDMNTGSIVVRHGKGGKQRVVHIGSKAQKALWKYITLYRKSNNDSLFINRNGEPLDAVGIRIFIKRLGIKAKVKVSPHKLRHTFAISYLRAGGDVFSLQYLLGHSTLQMTQRYLQSLNADDAIEAHRKFSPLDRLQIK
jgi:site-specific recombinase XerD